MKNDPTNLISLMSRKLRIVYGRIRNSLDALGLGELDISHGDILYQLYYKGDLSLKELAENIDRDKSTVTALVKKLEKMNMVLRYTDEDDKRISYLKLSEKGEGFRKDFYRISDELFSVLYENFSHKEKQELMRLVYKLK